MIDVICTCVVNPTFVVVKGILTHVLIGRGGFVHGARAVEQNRTPKSQQAFRVKFEVVEFAPVESVDCKCPL